MSEARLGAVKAVLFDLDGTLLDSAPDLGAAANALRTARGLEALPLAHYRPFVGTGARGMLRLALGTQPDDPGFDTLREEFFQAYEACMGQHACLFAGVQQVTQQLRTAGLSWGIVTNKSERFTHPIAQACPVLSQAQALVCGDTTPHAKPHPAPLLAAAQRLGIAPSDCLYVGDDERDMQAARAAGMGAVAAAYGYLGGVTSVTAWQPDAIIESPYELLNVLGLH